MSITKDKRELQRKLHVRRHANEHGILPEPVGPLERPGPRSINGPWPVRIDWYLGRGHNIQSLDVTVCGSLRRYGPDRFPLVTRLRKQCMTRHQKQNAGSHIQMSVTFLKRPMTG